jgi:hypothetical protein
LIEIGKDLVDTSMRLYFTPLEPGFQKYTVKIPAQENELTVINNQKNF